MKKGKTFFYKVVAADFAIAVMQIPDGGHKEWLQQLASDMVNGKGSFEYSKKIISEAKQFSNKKSEAGKKGMKNRWLPDNTVITNDNTVITHPTTDITISSSSNSNKRPYFEIIDDLNHKGGFRYKTGKATNAHINARFEEGFTKEDFFQVHSIKIAEWGNDPKMSKFLRPETLYGSKFQGYLNQPMPKKKKTILGPDGMYAEVDDDDY